MLSVCSHRGLPNSSTTLLTAQHLQRVADDVVNRRVDLLDPRDVVRTDDQWAIRQAAPGNLAAVVPEQRNGQEAALARFLERRNHVAGSSARREGDGDVLTPGLRDQLPQKRELDTDVVGDCR